MGPVKELSVSKRAQIAVLAEEGYSHREISRRMTVSLSTISRTLQRLAENNDFSSRKRCGRPKATTPHTDRMMHRYAVAHPFASSKEIRAILPPGTNMINTCTIRRRLAKDFALKCHKPAKKPRLTPKNVRDRLSFCLRYQAWTEENWNSVMFSDESKVQQFRSCRPMVRRPANERYNKRYICETVRSTPSVMIWGAITATGRCGLHFLPKGESLKASGYLKIIQQKVPSFMEIHNTTILQHDGAPCHSAKLIKDWISASTFSLLQGWPGNSPDLNPIEHCWNHIKACIDKHQCSSYSELIEKIKLVWTKEVPVEYCRKLIHSMPQRIAACLANKGGHTKY